jgi:molybdopterin converting factor small subunit
MHVAVQFHGSAPPGARRLSIELPDGATAGDLIGRLAEAGLPLAEFASADEPRLPRQLRVFAGGSLLARRDEPLAAGASDVTVVLLTPISGG